MKRSWCVFALVIGFIVTGCAPGTGRLDLPAAPLPLPATLRVQLTEGAKTVIRRVPLEEYVAAAIISEFAPASGEMAEVERMLEVQAVISRTYAVAHAGRHSKQGFDLCSTTHCQLFQPSRLKTSRWAPAAVDAVRNTAAAVLWFGGAPARALFHADCGGRTSKASRIWGGAAQSYLGSVEDGGAARGAHSAWSYVATVESLRAALNARPLTRVGARLDAIDVRERDDAGRAITIVIKGQQPKTVRGEDFRDALARTFGARAIRSAQFNVRRDGTSVIFEGRGFGHGVGLCQAGVYARVRAGETLETILRLYYPGTKLVRAS